MLVQKGGVILDQNKVRDATGFNPVSDMLFSSSSQLKVFTASSLKGFMLELNVQPKHSKYLTQTKTNKRFSTPVESFILKYVVIAPSEYDPLTNYMGEKYNVQENGRKAPETQTSFYQEAVMQQAIWVASATGDRDPICPSVANLSMFEHDASLELLNMQKSYLFNKNITNDVIDYLIKELEDPDKQDYQIGILTMPKVLNSTTLYDFVEKKNKSKEVLQKTFSSAIAKLVRLFIDNSKTFHFDLHGGNVLVMNNTVRDVESMIIDFGNAFRFGENSQNEVNDLLKRCQNKSRPATRTKIENLINDCFTFSKNKYEKYFYEKSDDEKKDYIAEVLTKLLLIEQEITTLVYGKYYNQMSWLNYIDDLRLNRGAIYLDAFNLMKIDTTASGHTSSFFRKHSIDLDNTLLTTIPQAPQAMPLIANVPKTTDDRSNMICNIAGCFLTAAAAAAGLAAYYNIGGGKSKRRKTRKLKRKNRKTIRRGRGTK
jgi:hypothetical protein